MKNIKKIKENLLVEYSVDFMVESHEEIILKSIVAEGEEATSSAYLKLTGVFQKGNVPNGNNRIYRTELLVRENKRFQSKINQGTALGKGYHPDIFDAGGPAGVTDVAHRIIKTWMEGDIVRGELLVLKTAIGKDIEAIIAGGGKIGISSRGYGSMERHEKIKIAGRVFKNVFVVDENYVLETYDLVLTPSVKSAMMRPIKAKKGESLETDNSNCNEEKNVDEGGNNSMTLEELKSLHPELYNTVHAAAFEEGKKAGEKVSETAVEAIKATHIEAVGVKDKSISDLKATNETITAENVVFKTENDALKADVAKATAEKLGSDIDKAIADSIAKSDFKDYFKEEDIKFIKATSDTVENAVKEVGAREKVYENAVATFKAASTVDTKSKSVDTSEDNSNGKTNESAVKTFNQEQANLAFE